LEQAVIAALFGDPAQSDGERVQDELNAAIELHRTTLREALRLLEQTLPALTEQRTEALSRIPSASRCARSECAYVPAPLAHMGQAIENSGAARAESQQEARAAIVATRQTASWSESAQTAATNAVTAVAGDASESGLDV
jgi:hypothetical protein